MKEPGEWADDLQRRLRSLDGAARWSEKEKIIKDSAAQAWRMVLDEYRSNSLSEKIARMRAYTKAIERVAREARHDDAQREQEQRAEKIQARREDQARQKLAEAQARQQRELIKKDARKQRRLNQLANVRVSWRGFFILLLLSPLFLYGVFGYGAIFLHGMVTGELVFANRCDILPLKYCLSKIPRHDAPFDYYVGMAIFLGLALVCALFIWSVCWTLWRLIRRDSST